MQKYKKQEKKTKKSEIREYGNKKLRKSKKRNTKMQEYQYSKIQIHRNTKISK